MRDIEQLAERPKLPEPPEIAKNSLILAIHRWWQSWQSI
jgi:hypothetical protein